MTFLSFILSGAFILLILVFWPVIMVWMITSIISGTTSFIKIFFRGLMMGAVHRTTNKIECETKAEEAPVEPQPEIQLDQPPIKQPFRLFPE